MSSRFGTQDLLACYRRGVFPMADSRDDPNLFLIDPDERGLLLLDAFHVPRRLRKTIRKQPYDIRVDTAFARVMEGCAASLPGRESTWINSAILNLYCSLHREGHAHSVEAWMGEELVGGLYGVSIGGAFFGESMFSTATDASKIALVHLVARLIKSGYSLLDAQFTNPHLEQFGLVEVTREEFRARLAMAVDQHAMFPDNSANFSGTDALAIIDSVQGKTA
ncbi:MAG: leucyl/phenylalanyl-tRNA--protein transferase [Pseudomonadota bacterium]